MFFRPATQSVQRLNQRSAETCQRVLNFWWNDRVNFALDQTVALKAAQSLRQHLLRNAADLTLERGVTFGAVSQHLNDERRPFVCDPIEHEPGRTLRIHDRAAGRRLWHDSSLNGHQVRRKKRVAIQAVCMVASGE